MTAASTARLPCRCSSATSSPVTLRGPGNHSASPSSSVSPLAGSRTRTCRATRGGGSAAGERLQSRPGLRAGSRTIAIAARPGAVAGA